MTNSPMDPRDRAFREEVRTEHDFDRTYDAPADRGAYGDEPIVVRDRPFAAHARNGAGTAALVLGILGVLTAVFLIGGLLGLIAVVCGVVGLGRVKRGEATNRGSAIAGITLGLLAIAITAGMAIAGKNFYDNNKEEFGNLSDCNAAATTDAARTACAEQFKDAVTP